MAIAIEQHSRRIISVAICTRNRSALLLKTLQTVLPQLTPNSELLVVDNASTDDTRQICEQQAQASGRLTYCLESRLGLSAARNTALRHATGEFVLFLDDDALAEPGWLAAYQNFLSQPPSPKVVAVGGGVIPFCDSPPSKWIQFGGRFHLGSQAKRLSHTTLVGCNSAYHREKTLAVGAFDERLGYRGDKLIPREESELQTRLVQAGGECWWLPGAVVRHRIAVERLTFMGVLRSNYNAGRAAAIHRLKMAGSAGRRFWLRAGRLVITPVHVLLNFLVAVLFLALWRRWLVMGAMSRASRALGLARQMMARHAPEPNQMPLHTCERPISERPISKLGSCP